MIIVIIFLDNNQHDAFYAKRRIYKKIVANNFLVLRANVLIYSCTIHLVLQ